MSENQDPNGNREPGGNPWMKSLLVWGGIFLALLLVVSMFGNPAATQGTQMRYSDFRSKVTGSPASFPTAIPSPPFRCLTTPI